MPIRTVSWISSSRLACGSCDPANVILCLPSSLVAQKTCPIDPVLLPEITENTNYPYKTIRAQITGFSPNGGCGGYRYTFSYDDVQLVPQTTLTRTDINGVVCEGCLTTFIEEVAGREIFLEVIPGNLAQNIPDKLRLTSQHGCQFEFMEPGSFGISGDTGTPFQVYPTETLPIVGGDGIETAASDPQLVVSAKLSEDEGNAIEFGDDGGLYVPSSLTGGFLVDADTGTPQTISPGDTLTVAGADGIQTSVTAGDLLTVAIDFSNDSGNSAGIGGDNGLYVPAVGITSSNNCVAGGVGPTYMVRSATLGSTNQIVLNAAPEHTRIVVGASDPVQHFVNNPPASPTAVDIPGSSVPNALVINNPSLCRSMIGRAQLSSELLVDSDTTTGLAFEHQVSALLFVNGGGPFRQVGYTQGSSNGSNVNTFIGVSFPPETILTIPAGGSINLGYKTEYNNLNNAGMNRVSSINTGFVADFSTV